MIGGADQVGVPELARPTGPTTSCCRSGNVVLSITHGIADVLGAVIEWLQLLISTPAFPSPYPEIGFLGVLALAWFLDRAGRRLADVAADRRLLRAVLAARLLQGQHGHC